MKTISWDSYFMSLAVASAARSKDPRTKVGSVIVNSDNHIIATGFNGMPPGFPETQKLWDSQEKHHYVIHAEMNAIAHATESVKGCTLYTTLKPCPECAKLISASQIKKVVYLHDRPEYQLTDEIFKHSNVQTYHKRYITGD